MSEFDRNTLISMYKEKIIRDHKIPTARDINSDYFFPSYSEFKRKFGGKKIREVKELSDLIKYYCYEPRNISVTRTWFSPVNE